jgi:hypothetical protein
MFDGLEENVATQVAEDCEESCEDRIEEERIRRLKNEITLEIRQIFESVYQETLSEEEAREIIEMHQSDIMRKWKLLEPQAIRAIGDRIMSRIESYKGKYSKIAKEVSTDNERGRHQLH